MRERVSPPDLELSLHSMLIGVKLVTEIGLTREMVSELEEAVRRIQAQEGANWFRVLLEDYWCIYICYLVGFGIYEYKAGELWGRMPIELPGPERGPAFVRALETVGLDTFDQMVETERAQSWVSRILIHGGIPSYCIPDFFLVLARSVGRGASEASDVLTHWRNVHSALDHIDKPVRRFLMNGGAVSRDLIDRCLELMEEHAASGTVPDPSQIGLPPYIVEGFVACRQGVDDELKGRQLVRLPRPQLVVDPWLPSGPCVELPPLRDLSQGSDWVVRADDTSTRVECTTLEAQRVLVKPARSWDVMLEDHGHNVRSFHLGGLENAPVLVADPVSGNLLRDLSQVRSEEIWLVAPTTVRIEACDAEGKSLDLCVVEEFPLLEGTWQGWMVRHVDLHGLSSLRYEKKDAAGHIHILRPIRPVLAGTPVPHIKGVGGEPIYAEMPTLILPSVADVPLKRWLVRVDALGSRTSRSADQLEEVEGSLDLAGMLPAPFGEVSIRVQGPLGSDLRADFVVIPGLTLAHPKKLLAGQLTGVVKLSADAPTMVEDARPGELKTISLPLEDDVVPVRFARTGSRHVDAQVQVSRVVWALARGEGLGGRFRTTKVAVSTTDLSSGSVRFLFVRTRQPNLTVLLHLEDNAQCLQTLESTTAGVDGRAVFDLWKLADTATASGSTLLALVLEVGALTEEAGSVTSPLHFGDVLARGLFLDGKARVSIELSELTSHRNRVLRLWPLDRPWNPPIVERLVDGPMTQLEVVRDDDSLRIGRYLLELLVDDGWIPLSEAPNFTGPGARIVLVGSDSEWRSSIRSRTATEPIAVLEAMAATGKLLRSLSETELDSLMPQAVATLLAIAGDGPQSSEFASLVQFCRMLAPLPRALIREVVRWAEARQAGTTALRRITLGVITSSVTLESIGPEDDAMERLWAIFPPLAAAVSIPNMGKADSLAVQAQCEQYLTERGEDGQWLTPVGLAPLPHELELSPDQIAAIEKEARLVPEKLLSMDAYVATMMEWLQTAQPNPEPVQHWVSRAGFLVEDLQQMPDSLHKHLSTRFPQRRVPFHGCYLPYLSLAACLHIATGSPRANQAATHLDRLLPMAGALVIRDLVLAQLLVEISQD